MSRAINYAISIAHFLLHPLLRCYRRPEKVHLLDTQCRMDAKLLEFPNMEFYGGRIKTAESVKNRSLHVANSFQLVSTSGCASEAKNKFSWCNDYEATVIKSLLKHDEDILCVLKSAEANGLDARVIVITPCEAQVACLRRKLQKIKWVQAHDISTVDSFQGQEGDIVLVSTVRTKSVGFIDDANRLCVALTRAKRVLRVVGDVEFYNSIKTRDSVLRALAKFATSGKVLRDATIEGAEAWKRPDWSLVTKWRPMMTSRFHHSLREMSEERDRNVALNTLLTISLAKPAQLRETPKPSRSRQMSTLKNSGGRDVSIVWVAQASESNVGQTPYVGNVVVEHAGERGDCLQFLQKNHLVPKAAFGVEKDLSGLILTSESEDTGTLHETERDLCRWEVTNELQTAIADDLIEALPEGLFALDNQQERVITLKPPLLLESRSGTGKTNVLFQHAMSHARGLVGDSPKAVKAICFVTVSSNLREELQKRHNGAKEMVEVELPPIVFLSFKELLQKLLDVNKILDKKVASACAYIHYVNSRTSHQKLPIEPS